ncbi:MAG: STAS domain-containing protein, partial [Chitinivibrionales bacterium]|nr:STAS domain-containing protein [Chitinivibrionales bacterium]MBD3395067.1 STAS domain-containing protein [Chitinivibrionales bacterium]
MPEMSGDEIFDSTLLEQTIVSLIQQGKRNFALDLSPLDYIYSDTMNRLLAINRQILDVSGRLSLLSPQEEVRQILERAGIHNFLRIYQTDEDLKRASDDIVKQTQSISLDAVRQFKAAQEAPPKSEFEDFRSEIDRAFAEPSEEQQQPSQPQRPAAFTPPPPPKRPEP